MPALAATLTEFADNGDSRTYTTSGHTAVKPKVVVERRKVPLGGQTVAEFSATISQGVEDAEGMVMPAKVAYAASVRYPVDADPTDLAAIQAACLTLLRDIVASDEFGASTTSQNWFE